MSSDTVHCVMTIVCCYSSELNQQCHIVHMDWNKLKHYIPSLYTVLAVCVCACAGVRAGQGGHTWGGGSGCSGGSGVAAAGLRAGPRKMKTQTTAAPSGPPETPAERERSHEIQWNNSSLPLTICCSLSRSLTLCSVEMSSPSCEPQVELMTQPVTAS